jgi:alkane 1-monooxygenase
MTDAVPIVDETLTSRRQWTLHLWSFVLPLLNLAFVWTGPHGIAQAIVWTLPIWILVAVDNRAPADRRAPAPDAPAWAFDLQVYLLVALQFLNHVMLGVMASKLSVASWQDLLVTIVNFGAVASVCGTTAGYSGIVLAHELVHRRKWHEYTLGRVLLMCVLYEHFATEHVRGHHPRIGTAEDPATARFGETFRDFFRRTVPAQFKSAWHLEKVRLGDEHMRWSDPRMLRHRVLQGLVGEAAILAAFAWAFGPIALFFFVVGQARSAIFLLEVVNYVEHWGLVRVGRKVTPLDSWDTDNWFTLHTLVGLSRHSDHHSQASRPYYALRAFGESPKMPRGYYGTILMAAFNNKRYQKVATAELQRKKLGPFRELATVAAA